MTSETIDERNRPRDPYFYSGAPSYYKLKFQVYDFLSATNERDMSSSTSFTLKDKASLEQILDESIDDKKVLTIRSCCAKFNLSFQSPLQYNHLAFLVKELNSHKFPVQEDFLKCFHDPSKSSFEKTRLSYKSISQYKSACIGRRKTAVSKVGVESGEGKIVVNAKSLLDYFPRLEDRQQVLFPLNLVGCLGTVNVSAEVSGGGPTGNTFFVRFTLFFVSAPRLSAGGVGLLT